MARFVHPPPFRLYWYFHMPLVSLEASHENVGELSAVIPSSAAMPVSSAIARPEIASGGVRSTVTSIAAVPMLSASSKARTSKR